MIVPYCTADGSGPRASISWSVLVRAARTEAGLAVVGARRIAEASHLVRNGNEPINGKCPECLAPVALGTAIDATERAREMALLLDQIALADALEELPDTPDGMDDPVLLVGGPLDAQVVDWPANTAWQSVRSFFGADVSLRAFEYGTQTVAYRRNGGTASVEASWKP